MSHHPRKCEYILDCEDGFRPCIKWPSSGGTFSDFQAAISELTPTTRELRTIALATDFGGYCCDQYPKTTGMLHVVLDVDTPDGPEEHREIWDALVAAESKPAGFYELAVHLYWLTKFNDPGVKLVYPRA